MPLISGSRSGEWDTSTSRAAGAASFGIETDFAFFLLFCAAAAARFDATLLGDGFIMDCAAMDKETMLRLSTCYYDCDGSFG